MFKKILAGLAILGMLMGGTIAATANEKSEKLPILQDIVYKVTADDTNLVALYLYDHGQVNIMAWIFGGVFISEAYFMDEATFLKLEDYRALGGTAALVMTVPYDEGRSLVFLEIYGDGDTLVDAVAIDNGDEGLTVLRYFGEEIPSVYSAEYKRILSSIIHDRVYADPIQHAVIDMGPAVGVENDA